MNVMRALRLCSYAPDWDRSDPYAYDWWLEGTHDGAQWVRLIGDGESNYDTAVALVEIFNAARAAQD